MTEDRYDLLSGWEEVDFERCIEIPHGPFIKIPQKKYLPKGKYPIIDQGSEFIAGYTDNKNDVCKGRLPVIIFGDHTRIFKFVDFAFAIGADGTKILKAKEGIDPKYLYYYLKSIELPSRGYSRHYRYLRENKILLAPENEQERIVKKIELLLERLTKTKQNLAMIPPLLKKFRHSVLAKAFSGELTEEWRAKQKDLESTSRLLERIREERRKLLGKKYKESEPVDTSDLPELLEGWEWARISDICTKAQYGWTTSANFESKGVKLLRTTDISSGTIDWETVPYCQKEPEDIEKYLLHRGDILVSRAGSVGVSIEINNCPKAIFASYLIRFRFIPPILTRFISLYLKSPYYWSSIVDKTAGIAIPNVNATKLENLFVPLMCVNEQEEIIRRIDSYFAQADAIEKSVKIAQAHCEKLTQSILAKAFRGELTEKN